MEGLAGNLMVGAGAIAEYLFGKDTKKNRRKVYYLHAGGILGTFILGGKIAARRSTIVQRIAERERGIADPEEAA